MEKWSEKGHSTRAVQATPAQAFRQPFSACSRWNTGADSRSLRLLQPLVPGASDRPHDRCAPVMPIATPMSESPPSCRLTTPTMKMSWPACSDPPGQRHDKRKTPPCGSVLLESGAGNETRIHGPNLGKVAVEAADCVMYEWHRHPNQRPAPAGIPSHCFHFGKIAWTAPHQSLMVHAPSSRIQRWRFQSIKSCFCWPPTVSGRSSFQHFREAMLKLRGLQHSGQ